MLKQYLLYAVLIMWQIFTHWILTETYQRLPVYPIFKIGKQSTSVYWNMNLFMSGSMSTCLTDSLGFTSHVFSIKPCYWSFFYFYIYFSKWNGVKRIEFPWGWSENLTGSWGHSDEFLVVNWPTTGSRKLGQVWPELRTLHPLPPTAMNCFLVLFHFLLNCCCDFAIRESSGFWNETYTSKIPVRCH